ncbi:MAG: SIR2 family protein, partial [Peptostreptococcaceae bacterium]
MKITIFLGAGASAAENLPIQNEIFIQYFKDLTINDYNKPMNRELHRFFNQMFNIDLIKDKIENINFPTFEEVLGILDLAEQRKEFFKNFALEIVNKESDSIRFVRQYLILLMACTVNKSTINNYHKLLVENLLRENLLLNTTFISANYDIIIDNTIASIYDKNHTPIMLDYGINFSNFTNDSNWIKPIEPKVSLFKIHGSLNWMFCPICSSLTLTPYEGGVMRILDNIDGAKCLDCGDTTVPIIVPPTYFKNISNVFLSSVWHESEKALRDSDILVLCGYSFPESDVHIKYMIKRVQTSRKKA